MKLRINEKYVEGVRVKVINPVTKEEVTEGQIIDLSVVSNDERAAFKRLLDSGDMVAIKDKGGKK